MTDLESLAETNVESSRLTISMIVHNLLALYFKTMGLFAQTVFFSLFVVIFSSFSFALFKKNNIFATDILAFDWIVEK